MILLETIFSMIIIIFIANFINKPFSKDNQASIKEKNVTLAVSSLLVIGFNLVLRYAFGYLGFLIDNLQIFGSGVPDSFEQIEFLFFAIMITLFFPIYNYFFKKICKNTSLEGTEVRNKKVTKGKVIIIGVSWIVALMLHT
jgi:hypothetical protein